ncbi:uncharacterized protein TM35_000921050, partial [Trypanosoma theileri]
GQPKAVMAYDFNDFLGTAIYDYKCGGESEETVNGMKCANWRNHKNGEKKHTLPDSTEAQVVESNVNLPPNPPLEVREEQEALRGEEDHSLPNILPTTSIGPGSKHQASESATAVTHPSISEIGGAQPGGNAESMSTTERQVEESTAAKQGHEEVSSNTTDNSTAGNSNATQQSSPASVGATAVPESQETNTTTPQSPESNVTDTPTTTPSTVPNGELTTIASAVQKNRPNVDSSINPVWMRTAAPLLIVAMLFSATVY